MRIVRGHQILNEDLLDDMERSETSAAQRVVDDIEREWDIAINVEMFFDMRRPEIVKRYKELVDHFDVYLGDYVKVEIEPHQKNQPARTKDLYIYLSDDTNFKSPKNLWRFLKALIDWIPGSNAVLYFFKNENGVQRQVTGQINDWLSKYIGLNLEPEGLTDGLTSADAVADRLTGFYDEVFTLFGFSKEQLKKWILTQICKPRVNEALNYDLLDDMDALTTNAVQKVVDDNEYISPLDEQHPFLIQITMLGTTLTDTRYFIKVRDKVQSIIDSYNLDTSTVELHIKKDFQAVANRTGEKRYDIESDPLIIVNETLRNNLIVFALNPESMTIKKVQRLYDAIFNIFRKFDCAVDTIDKRTKENIIIQTCNTLDMEYKQVMLCHMFWPEKYDHSLKPYYKIVDCPADEILKDLACEPDAYEYCSEMEQDVDIRELMDSKHGEGKYEGNPKYVINVKRMNGQFEVENLLPDVYNSITMDGEMMIHEGDPYVLYFNDEVGDQYFEVLVYLGPGFMDAETRNSNAEMRRYPGEICIGCPFYIQDDTTWNDYHEWLADVKRLFGGELPDDLGEQIQDAFQWHNIELETVEEE